MGLDMYLTASREVEPSEREALRVMFPEVAVETVSATVGYWRKANAIHAWFVRNVQGGEDDCLAHCVDQDDVEALLVLVDDVIEKKRKPEEALPTWVGPFFGDTAYDQAYFAELGRTKAILEQALALTKSGWRVRYQSSW